MRIISGSLGGRKLKNFKSKHIRPTTDRVKESVFNKLTPYILDAQVLDLFSGTGNLAIESYSRGAKRVVAVENSKKSLEIINDNLRELKISNGIKLIPKEVLSFLKTYEGEPFDIVLIDPPFTKKMAHETMIQVSKSKILNPGGIIMIESSSHEQMDESYEGLDLWERKSYGDKNVSFFTKGNE